MDGGGGCSGRRNTVASMGRGAGGGATGSPSPPYRSPSDSAAIFCWRRTMPCSSASGRGGQPGTYTSTGMIWSTPLVTQYESQYGPPQLEQAPKEMTYLGSGICSYSRLTAGAILSLTVPETTIRSACRGPGANGITPSRMKSCRDIEVAMNSIAQQAWPKLNTHREYRRPQLSTNLIGFGASL